MAAVATQQFTVQNYPFITDETRQLLAQEKIRLLRDESAVNAADLNRNERYVFRSKPGTHRMIYHNIDIPPIKGGKHYEHYRYQWELRQIALAGLNADSDEKSQADAVAAAEKHIASLKRRNSNSDLIVFARVRRANECYFATDDDVMAAYLRDLKDRKVGSFSNVYEVSGKSRVVVGDKAFPDTELGWQAARTYAREHSVDDIKLVKD